MKICKYNNFEIRFTKEKNELRPRYDLGIFENAFLDQDLFYLCKNQIVQRANDVNNLLGVFDKFLIVKNSEGIILLWTSFKGKPEIYHLKSYESFYDYLILSFAKKKQKVLYHGDRFEAPLAGWRNQVNVDILTSTDYEPILERYLTKTVETYLPF